MKKILTLLVALSLIHANTVYAKKSRDLKIEEIVLPTEVNSLQMKSGSIFYSKSVKNKVLIPANFWGEVGTTGLHFIPEGTNLIKGLSLAGGPTGNADISQIEVTRTIDNEVNTYRFDLRSGGSKEAHKYNLASGDVIFVQKDRFYENRAYYTGLISVATTILTGLLLYKQINTND